MVATSQFTISVINDGQDGAPGGTGPQGVSVVKVVPEYRISDSSSGLVPADGTPGIGSQYIWSETKPEIPSGKYLWTRERTDLSDNTPSAYSDAHCDIVISNLVFDVNENAQAITSKISQDQLSTAISNYDSSTVSTIRNSVSQMTQNLTGITSRVETVESTYATKAEVGSNNLYVIADQVPGYLHQSSGAIIAQDSLGKEYTSAFIPVNKGDRITIQSWCTPLDGQGEVRTGYSWLAYQFFSDDDPVTPVSDRIDKWGYSSGSGVETTAEGQEHLTYSTFIPEATNVKYIRVSYRSYEDGYAMVEKSTTPSEYIINPRDLQDYTDTQVSSVRTIAEQTADQFSWLVESGDSSSTFTLTDRTAELVANYINLNGKVTFNGLNSDTQNTITTASNNASTAVSTANTANNTANLANEKVSLGLGMKVNYDIFSGANNGECYIHGYTDGVAADVDGYVYWNGVKRTVPKKMLNPNAVVPNSTTIYIVLRLSSTESTTGTLYMVYYDSVWKYAITPTPTSVATWTWAETTDIILGQFVRSAAAAESEIVDAYLYVPPKNVSDIILDAWKGEAVNGVTTINGGLIQTNTIETKHLATDAIKSNNYSPNDSSVYSTVGTFLDLANGNIKSPTFAVDNTAGMAYIDGAINARYLYLGMSSADLASSDGTLASSGGDIAAIAPVLGSYIYYDGETLMINTENFHIGSDGNVSMSGSINSTSGSIGGWEISENDIHYGMDIGQSGTAYLIPAGSTTSHSIGGSTTISGWTITSGDSFGVTNTGALYASDVNISGTISASSGSIGSWLISPDYLSYGTIGQANSAFLVPNGTSSAYSIGGSPAISGWVLTAGENFGVTNTGALYASNANITGKINATTGSIGGFTIRNNEILNDLGFFWETTINNVRYNYWCGLKQKGGSPSVTSGSIRMFEITRQPLPNGSYASQFYVGSDGYLFCQSGTLGGWTLTSTQITATGNSKITGMQIPSHGVWSFAAGATDANNWATAPFRVKHNGELYSTAGQIGGFTITSTGINSSYLHLSSVNGGAAIQVGNGSGATGYVSVIQQDGFFANSSTHMVSAHVSSDGGEQGFHVLNDNYGTHTYLSAGYNCGIRVDNSSGKRVWFMQNENGNSGIYNETDGNWGVVYNYDDDFCQLRAKTCSVRIGAGNTSGTKTFMPRAADGGKSDGTVYCGASDCRWHTVYSKNGTSTSSDERLKKIYRHLGDDHKKLFMELKPIEYSFIDDLDKKHFGLGAQTTEISMDRLGFGSEYNIVEHSFYSEADTYGRHDTYNMNYIEALVLAIPVVQEHEKEIERLKARITELENKLHQITQ